MDKSGSPPVIPNLDEILGPAEIGKRRCLFTESSGSTFSVCVLCFQDPRNREKTFCLSSALALVIGGLRAGGEVAQPRVDVRKLGHVAPRAHPAAVYWRIRGTASLARIFERQGYRNGSD